MEHVEDVRPSDKSARLERVETGEPLTNARDETTLALEHLLQRLQQLQRFCYYGSLQRLRRLRRLRRFVTTVTNVLVNTLRSTRYKEPVHGQGVQQ